MRIRAGLIGVLVCVALTSCNRGSTEPHPTRTLEPSITESSPIPTANADNPACDLLTAKERSDLAGYALDAEVPVRPDPGTEECVWVRSLQQSSRAAIRVVALRTPIWSRQIAPQIRDAIVKPTTGRSLRVELEKALAELVADPDGLSSERTCETYVLLAKSRGADLGIDQVGYGQIGALPAAYAVTCEGGIMTLAGYGEYGLGQSLALNRGVIKLAEAASARAAEELGTGDGGDTATGEDASPSPEPAPGEADEAEPEDEDES